MPTNPLIQQDASEFMLRIFDKVEYSLKNTPYKYLIKSIFGGETCSQVNIKKYNNLIIILK